MARVSNSNLPAGFDPSTCCSVYVGNIHHNVTESDLIQVFQRSGPVKRCRLIPQENCSIGFVEYNDPRSAALAIRNLHGQHMYGHAIKVNCAFASTHREGKFSIFVGDLCSEVNSATLFDHFSAYPSCSCAEVMRDNRTRRSKGYGFVYFHNQQEAETAITEMTDKWLGSRKIKCNWATRTNDSRARNGISDAEGDGWTSFLISLYESLKPSHKRKSQQRQLINSLEKLVRKVWPNARLHHYGSGASSFGTPHSDVDICLEIVIRNDSVSNVLRRLAHILRTDGYEDVKEISHAIVPIVMMTDPKSGFPCDVSINNHFAVANTKLLRDYAQIDVRLVQLALLVKHWAKQRKVNNAGKGTLASYAYVLMCISFLQQRKPKILPCLQAMKPATYRTVVHGTEYTYFDKVCELGNFGAKNKENIGELLWAFFNYWAYDHDYARDVMSVRLGKTIRKEQKNWDHGQNGRHLICIEDPFETSYDLGRAVNKQTLCIIRKEFERAADILNGGSRATLFEPKQP